MSGDPLADLPEPSYHPEGIERVAAAQVAASHRLADLATSLRSETAARVGSSWTGEAAQAAAAFADQLAAAHDTAAGCAASVGSALTACAARWRDAHSTYQQARHLADVALTDEADHRRAGQQRFEAATAAHDPIGAAAAASAASGADGYSSPLRARSRQLAQQAITDYQQAAQAAASAVSSSADVFSPPPAPAASAPGAGHQADKPWWQDALDWVGARASDAGGAISGAASDVFNFGGYAVTHPLDSLKVGGDLALSGLGVLGMIAGAGGEVGGFALDATGVGAVGGVPLNVASAGLIAVGAGAALSGTALATQDLSTMWMKSQSSGDGSSGSGSAGSGGSGSSGRVPQEGSTDGGPGRWVGVNRGGGSSRAWDFQLKNGGLGRYPDGRIPEYEVNGVKFDNYANGELQDSKGAGYAKLLAAKFRDSIANDFIKEAQGQIFAAGGTPVRWQFAEKDAADAVRALFRRNGIPIIVDGP